MLILASGSPRRLELLRTIGVSLEVRPADIDETPHKGEKPAEFVLRMAEEKCAAVFNEHRGVPVLAADTIVVMENEIFGKAKNKKHAHDMLERLQGQTHQVMTAVSLKKGERSWSEKVTTLVTMKRLDAKTIENYLETREYEGKAGAYAIQGIAAAFVKSVEGSVSSVIGLPLAETFEMLNQAELHPDWSKAIPA